MMMEAKEKMWGTADEMKVKEMENETRDPMIPNSRV